MAIIRQKGDYESVTGNNIYLIDLDTGEKLGLMGLPKELDYAPESTWATHRVPGRNTPHYHHVGAEDTLTLELSWWAVAENKQDVVKKCKWIEALTKADGWKNRPPIVKLHWGLLYDKAQWVVTAAPYKMTDFDKSNGYMPIHATQTVTLKRYYKGNVTTAQTIDWQT